MVDFGWPYRKAIDRATVDDGWKRRRIPAAVVLAYLVYTHLHGD